MASRQVGPWKLMVKDRAGMEFERFIASDGNKLAWVWRETGDGSGSSQLWEKLKAPWLSVLNSSRTLMSEYRPGISFAELLESSTGEGLTLGAAATLSLAVARGLEQLPEAIDRDEVPAVTPESILIAFDGAVTLLPWPDLQPSNSDGRYVLVRGEYFAPEQWRRSELMPGWRAYAPSLVLLHALEGALPDFPFRQETERLPAKLGELITRSLNRDARKRPAIDELIAALTPLSSPRELEDTLSRHFSHEPREQQYERNLAEGRDPEPLPADLIASISNAATDEAFGVLADWLLAEGHPRGELAAIQLKLEKGAQHELMRAEAGLLQRHRSLLPFTLRERLQLWKPIWKAGWLVGLELKTVPEPDVLTEILTHPTLRFLQRIRVKPDGGGSKLLTDVLCSLTLPALRQVELDGGVHIHGARLRQAHPQLRVESNKSQGFPARRRPEASIPNAKVGVGDREPAPGLPPLNRLIDWLSGDD